VSDPRIQGIAVALAELVRLHGSEVEAGDVLRGFGITREDLQRAGADLDDISTLREALDMQRFDP
jgi:uncharacterized protein (DUF433 family)